MVVFDDSILNNITMWIKAKIIKSCLMRKLLPKASIFDFIEDLPEKYDTLAEIGVLSLRQRQRLFIARELYRIQTY